jgi:hypothetical protein
VAIHETAFSLDWGLAIRYQGLAFIVARRVLEGVYAG